MSAGFSIAALRFADHGKLPECALSPGMTKEYFEGLADTSRNCQTDVSR
jgi:hypothetical protein